MAENLRTHAQTQRTAMQTALTGLRADLDAARTALNKRVADPTAVPRDTWRTALGARQYLETTVARDTELRADEARIRAALAAIATPADHATQVAALAANLLAQAESRVLRRDAEELVAFAEADVAAASAGITAGTALLAEQDRWLAAATDLQNGITADRAALTAAPLSTLRADAAALAGSATFTSAETALRNRLPADLFDRSRERFAEAADVESYFDAVSAAAGDQDTTLTKAAMPLAAEVDAADRALADARAALRAYLAAGPDVLARQTATLQRLAAVPPLTADETAALAPNSAVRPDAAKAVAAVPLERAVATAWQDYVDADLTVRTARFAAVRAHPDTDPGTDAADVAAVATRDSAPIAGALNAAKTAYTAAHQAALDAWEAAAPGWLWDAARDLHATSWALTTLADASTVTDLVVALDTAVDRVAAARDAAAAHARAAVKLTAERARAAARAAALGRSTPQRVDAFVRGDDLGGRHGDEY